MSPTEILRRKLQSEESKKQTQPLFENRLYCKKEVAKILHMSVKTVDMMMKRKEIEFMKLGVSVRFNPTYLNNKFGV